MSLQTHPTSKRLQSSFIACNHLRIAKEVKKGEISRNVSSVWAVTKLSSWIACIVELINFYNTTWPQKALNFYVLMLCLNITGGDICRGDAIKYYTEAHSIIVAFLFRNFFLSFLFDDLKRNFIFDCHSPTARQTWLITLTVITHSLSRRKFYLSSACRIWIEKFEI